MTKECHKSLIIILLILYSAGVVAFSSSTIKARNMKLYLSQDEKHEYDNEEIPEEARRLFDKVVMDFLKDDSSYFPSSLLPKNPYGKGVDATGGKGSLYSDEDLKLVLNIHNEISDELSGEESTGSSDFVPLSIHDLVTRTLDKTSSSNIEKLNLDASTKERVKRIRAIASDIDGTILAKDQTIHPRTRNAIIKAIESSQGTDKKIKYFFPATGKSRKGALDSIGPEIGSMISNFCAGVYLQGLFCIDNKGNIVFERKLNVDAIIAAENLVSETGVSIVAYDGDSLYTTKETDIVAHLSIHYGEPLPVLLPREDPNDGIRSLSSHKPLMHKLLLMDDDVQKLNKVVRPQLEELASKYDACVTQALPTMLELMPRGCSKALGVKMVCEALGIRAEDELLSIGDAENDVGMLKMASIGVAVGNASKPAREAADYVVEITNDQGGAGFIIQNFAFDFN